MELENTICKPNYLLRVVLKQNRPLSDSPKRGLYTYGETIQGKLILTTFGMVSVRCLQVELQEASQHSEAASQAESQLKSEEDSITYLNLDTDIPAHESFKEVQTVFPLENDIESRALDGDYEFGFSLKIPDLINYDNNDIETPSDQLSFYSDYQVSPICEDDEQLFHLPLELLLPSNIQDDDCEDEDNLQAKYELWVTLREDESEEYGETSIPITIRVPGLSMEHHLYGPWPVQTSKVQSLKVPFVEQTDTKGCSWIQRALKKRCLDLKLVFHIEPATTTSTKNFKLFLHTTQDLDEGANVPSIYMRSSDLQLTQNIECIPKATTEETISRKTSSWHRSSQTRELAWSTAEPLANDGVFKSRFDLSYLLSNIEVEEPQSSFHVQSTSQIYELSITLKFSASPDSWIATSKKLHICTDVVLGS